MRIKKVFSRSSEIVHLWANQTQNEARSNNTFFEARDPEYLWSYGRHFCVGRLLPNGYVALNSRHYSSTTSKHQWEARWATKNLKQLFVEDPDVYPSAESAQCRVDDLLELAVRARDRKGQHLAAAASIIEDFNLFCKLIGVKSKLKPIVVEGFDGSKLKKLVTDRIAAEKRRVKAAEKKAEAEMQEAILRWRNYENVGWGIQRVTTMLRLRQHAGQIGADSYFIETSRGASIPASDAVRLWPVIERVRLGTKDYEVGMSLGGYRLTQIKQDGSIKVGCHDIPYAELKSMHEQMSAMGLFNAVEEAA